MGRAEFGVQQEHALAVWDFEPDSQRQICPNGNKAGIKLIGYGFRETNERGQVG